MRIIYAKFKGYIGFNAIMGLDELEIDFSKSRHSICLIVGMNGSGKSTLLSALNIFPDNNTVYMKNKDGSKLIRLVDGNNLYEVEIISPYDGKGGRKTTKAFIRMNGEELNPNGNVSSYRDIIANEFELDSNFISLSMMTSVDRGLADKTPAERKKFVANVIENLVTYNNMYKTLNKKSLLYKSHINTLHTKIQSSGDKDALESNLAQLENQQRELEKAIEDLNCNIVYIQTKSEIDPEELVRINDINQRKSEIQSTLDSIQSSLDVYQHQLKIKPEDIISMYQKDSELLDSYTKNLNDTVAEWKIKQEQLVQSSQTINQLKASIGDEIYDRQLELSYSNSTDKLDKLLVELGLLNLSPKDVDSIDSIKDLLKLFNDFIQRLDSICNDMNPSDMEYIVYKFDIVDIADLQRQIEDKTLVISSYKDKIEEYNSKLRILSILDKRPNKCKINDCPFISEAFDLSKKISQSEIIEDLSKLQSDVLTVSKEIEEITDMIHYHQSMSSKAIEYHLLIDIVNNILSISPKDSYYGSLIYNELDSVDNKLARMYSFNLFRDPKEFINGLNVLQEYDSEYRSNEILKAQYLSYVEKIKVVESTKNTIEKLESESDELVKVVSELKNKIDKYKDLISTIQANYATKTQYASKYEEFKVASTQLEELESELKKFEKKSYDAAHNLQVINQIKEKISENKNMLDPVKNQISDIKGRLTLLNSYYNEYNNYNESYKFVEILKKYCSPTMGGIQTVFMQIYMAKTLELANNILGMLFGGSYRLLDFVINQNEFRIPFVGPSGLPADDISNGSNSQICMFSMVINLTLLHQASTKYNIAYLDEIDSGLDHRNRFDFINTLYNAIPMLGIEQLFMISHSMEADMSNVDIIKLKSYNDFEDIVDNGNVIFDYKNLIINS